MKFGSNAAESFLDFYDRDISKVTGGGIKLSLMVENSEMQRLLRLNGVEFPLIGGDEKHGVAFTVHEVHDMHGRIAYIKPGSDLEFLLKTQALNKSRIEIPKIPIYDLRTLITHDNDLYGVNFCWAASMFPVVLKNEYGLTAGKCLFDLLEASIRYENIDVVLAVGERARDYAGVAVDRIGLPFTASRPKGSKIKKDVIEVGCVSSYGLESGASEKECVEEKPHVVDALFMKKINGKRVAILDDLDATRNTLKSFGNAVREYGGEPIAITVDHLDYLPQGIVVPLDYPVRSILVENDMAKPVFTDYIKQLPMKTR